jgi:hypothetical protein
MSIPAWKSVPSRSISTARKRGGGAMAGA